MRGRRPDRLRIAPEEEREKTAASSRFRGSKGELGGRGL